MAKNVILATKLDTPAAELLRDQLLEAQGQDIALDGSGVDHLGGVCLELLMSAQHLWAAAGNKFELKNPSSHLTEDLTCFGVEPGQFAGDAA